MNDDTPQTEEFERRIREAAAENTAPKLGRGALSMLLAAAKSRPVLEEVLEQRNSVHGDFHQDSRISQALKHIVREGANWGDLSCDKKEALDHICTKMARILSGDPEHRDHWDDIVGYATLVARTLK